MARNLFGTVEAVGRTVQLNLADYTVVGVVKDVSKLAVSSYAQIWIPFNSTEIARKCWYDNAMGTFRVVILAHSEKDFPAIREEAERLRQKFNDGLQDSEIFFIVDNPMIVSLLSFVTGEESYRRRKLICTTCW